MIEIILIPYYEYADVLMDFYCSHYEYVYTWVDDTIFAGKDQMSLWFKLFCEYELEGVGPPTYHLVGHFKQVK